MVFEKEITFLAHFVLQIDRKNPALLQLDAINGIQVDGALDRPDFADLTPVYPNTKLKLERPEDPEN